jgi:predicted metalloenzyme YecM
MITTLTPFYTQAEEKIRDFNAFVQQTACHEKIIPDHFGYRCSSHEEFLTLREVLTSEANYFYQSIIAGRPIALFKLTKALQTTAGILSFLELSDQKPDGSQKSGFDHVEFFPKEADVGDLVTFFQTRGIVFTKAERPHHPTFDHRLESGLVVRIETTALLQKIITEEMV